MCDESALARTCVWCARRLHLPALNPPRPSISPRGLPNAATWNCDAGISRPMRFDGGPECVSCAAAGTEPSRTAGTELSRTEERGRGASNAVQVTSGSTVQNRVARLLSQRRGSAQPRMAASPRFRRVVQGGVLPVVEGEATDSSWAGAGFSLRMVGYAYLWTVIFSARRATTPSFMARARWPFSSAASPEAEIAWSLLSVSAWASSTRTARARNLFWARVRSRLRPSSIGSPASVQDAGSLDGGCEILSRSVRLRNRHHQLPAATSRWCATCTRRGARRSTRPSTCAASSSTAVESWSTTASTT